MLNALHVAAQGNQPAAIIYFLNKNLDVNSRDKVKSTPLHWACYAGAENSVSYLLANGADPNSQDISGYTPLHLAIKSSESIKSSRIVKQLLFSGAERNRENFDGLKPIDFTKGIKIHHIASDIKRSLAEPKYCSFLLLTQPLTKMKREIHTALCFIILLWMGYVIFFFYILPFIDSLAWNISINFLHFSSFILWLIWVFKDPGYLMKSEKIEFITLVERFEPGCLCPKCKIIRTPRSRHWNICDKWVERFDHHCPWINNCIGIKNHAVFFFFLVSIYSLLILLLLQILFNEKIYKGIRFLYLMACGFFTILLTLLLLKQVIIIFQEGGLSKKDMFRSRENLEFNNSERSFMESEGHSALLRNASIDSTLDLRKRGRWRDFWSMLGGAQMKDQYNLFMESMRRAGSNWFDSVLNDKQLF